MTGLVVALWSEARPLIGHFGLREAGGGTPFRLYRGDAVSLVISRVGKTASAAATAFLFAVEELRRDRPWLNVGIAGHGSLAVGEALLAHRVEDAGSGRTWSPCPLFDPPGALGTVRTFDRAPRRYASDAAHDMEAAGFIAIASRFSPPELTHVLKIVSDGPGTDLRALTARAVSELVAARLDAIERVVEETRALAADLAAIRPEVDPGPWLGRWDFTVGQRRRLESLLARLEVLLRRPVGPRDLGAAPASAAAVLERLEERWRAESAGGR